MRRVVRSSLVLASATALGAGLLLAPAHAAGGTGTYSTWTDRSTTPDSFAGAFPSTSFPSSVAAIQGTPGSMSSASSATLTTSTPFGARFGTSSRKQYLSIGGANGGATATAVITFDSPAPAGTWGFALGDVDADDITVTATKADGTTTLSAAELGWQGAFNYASGQTDVPTWNAGTQKLTGNTTDTSGASGWFAPTVDVSTVTLVQASLSGIPTYQLWIATDDTEATPEPTVIRYTVDIDANGGTCSVSAITGIATSWAALPAADACTREGYDLTGFSVTADGTGLTFAPGAPIQLTGDNRLFAVWKKIVPEPFLCTPALYQVSGTGGGVLYVYDPTRNTMDLVPSGGGPSRAPGSNATGFNPADDLIYGIAPNGSARHLWQFGSNGVYADLGAIVLDSTGEPVTNLSLIAGDFIADDLLMAIQTPRTLLLIDVAPTRSDQPARATLVTLPASLWGAADIAFTADRTAGYGMANNVLYIASLPGGDAAQQVSAAGQRTSYASKTVLGVPARATYGAAYLDQADNAYFFNNEERRIYLITATELAKDRPTAVPLGTEPAFVLGTNQTLQIPTDGASCPTAPIVTVTLTYDINGGRGETPGDQTGFVDQDVTVAEGTGFEREGATFAGWNTVADGSGTSYPPGALFNLGSAGGLLFAQWKPVEPAPVVPPENILLPIEEPEPPAEEGPEVVFTPLDEIPAPPGDPWNPATGVLVDPDTGDETPAVTNDSGEWSVNNRTGTVTYVPEPSYSGPAEMTVQFATQSEQRYETTLKTSVPSCERGESVKATVYFDVLSAKLSARSKQVLNELVRRAERRGTVVCSVVVGYVQPTPRTSNDISLSTARATSVADQLSSDGISRIVRTEGLGRADEQGARARRATATIYLLPE